VNEAQFRKRTASKLLTVSDACRRKVVCALVDGDVDTAIKHLQVEHRGASTSHLCATLGEIRRGLEYYTIIASRRKQ